MLGFMDPSPPGGDLMPSQAPLPPRRRHPAPRRATRWRSFWWIAGTVLAAALAITGLVVVGMFVLLIVGLNSWGGNK